MAEKLNLRLEDIFQIVSYHEAAPLLGVADAEQDDGDDDGAHRDPGHHGPRDPRLLNVHLPPGAVGGGAVNRHATILTFCSVFTQSIQNSAMCWNIPVPAATSLEVLPVLAS